MTHNEYVFDHLEGAGQSRNQVTPSETQVSSLQLEVESLKIQKRSVERDLDTCNKKKDELERTLLKVQGMNNNIQLKVTTLESERSILQGELNSMKLKLQRNSDENAKLKRDLKTADERAAKLEISIEKERKKSIKNDEEKARMTKIDIRKIEDENLSLILSLHRAQETVSTIAKFLALSGHDWHRREYQSPNPTWFGSFYYDDFETKICALIERFNGLNHILLNSDILQYKIYNNFILAFKKAVDVLCTPSHGKKFILYNEYQKKGSLTKDDIDIAKPLTIEAFMCYKTTESVNKPTLPNRKNFDLQVHREFENILCLYEGFDEDKRLKGKWIDGYGFHVFLDVSEEDIAHARRRSRIINGERG
jgi:hypothetical protein